MPGYFPNIQLLRDIAAPGGGGGAVYDPTKLTPVWEGVVVESLAIVLQPGWYCFTFFLPDSFTHDGDVNVSIPTYIKSGQYSAPLVLYGSGAMLNVQINLQGLFINSGGDYGHLKKIEKIG